MADRFPTGQLQQRLRARIEEALENGALQPMTTRTERVDDDAVPFVVRVVEAIEKKEEAARTQDADFDPFLPYDDRLWVADASASHVCLLNKFYVLEDHLLVVTRDFESQTAPLTLADFEAWRRCMQEFPSFGFYNGGPVAGASQQHKHLQVVSLPLAEWCDVPMESRFGDLPFPHELARFDDGFPEADELLQTYGEAFDRLALGSDTTVEPHNVLLTQRWMLTVPRTKERYESMSVNGLGFAGALLVRDDDELQRLRAAGPLAAVTACATPQRPEEASDEIDGAVSTRRDAYGPFTFQPRPRIPIPLPTDRIASARLVPVGDWFDDPMFVLRLAYRKRCLSFDLGEVRRLPTRVVHEMTDIFVSHAHLDHVRDFLWLIRKRLGCSEPCRLYGPTGFARRVRHMLQSCTWDRVGDRGPKFRVAEYDGTHLSWFALQVGDETPPRQDGTTEVRDGVILSDDRFVVRTTILDHGIPVLAYAVQESARYDVRPEVLREREWSAGEWLADLKARASAGRLDETMEVPGVGERSVADLVEGLLLERRPEKLVYATDFADTPANRAAVIELARDADVLICEASFRHRDREQAERTRHLTTRACAEIARAAEVTHLVPFHPSIRYLDEWEEHLAEVRAVFDGTVRGFREVDGSS